MPVSPLRHTRENKRSALGLPKCFLENGYPKKTYKAMKGFFSFMRFCLFEYCKVFKMRFWIPAYAGMT
jgi:hypothetical protein